MLTIGPRRLIDKLSDSEYWHVGVIDSDGGLGIATKRDRLRKVKFGQEEDYPSPGEQLHEMSEPALQDYYTANRVPIEYMAVTETRGS